MKKLFYVSALLAAFIPLQAMASNNTYSLGIEGFKDKYTESSLDVTDKTNYGSITGNYVHQSGKIFFAIDERASYGSDKYSSPSGVSSGAAQWEFDTRGRIGFTTPLWGGSLSPYTGIGWRYFRDEGKGMVTSTGAQAYDRRISQLYIPIGTSLTYGFGDGWSVTPQAEGDVMVYGNVDSRLTNNQVNYIPGIGYFQFLNVANNTQHFGYGGRGEIMFGKSLDGYSVEVGPFVRYWHVSESDKVTYTSTSGGAAPTVYEPTNERVQAGISAKLIW